jgi:hypothetical protein
VCGVDAHIYDEYGQALLRGEWPGAAPLFRTPLYTLYLGLNYALFGLNHYSPLIVQALLHVVAAAALYRAGCSLFSRPAGWLAALAYSLYGSLIFFTGCFDPISLVLPLLSLMLFFLVKFRQRFQLRYLVGAAVMIGLATLGRPTVLILWPVVMVWLWLGNFDAKAAHKGQWLRQRATSGGRAIQRWCVIFSIMVFLPVAPATIFNYSISGEFVLVSTNGPEVLFISNNADAEGRDILAPGIVQPAHQRMRQVVERIERQETTFVREVIQYISQEPLDWLQLQINKLRLLFVKSDLNLLTPAYRYPTTQRQIAVFEATPVQWHGLLILALLGMVLVRPKSAWLLLLYFVALTAVTIIFFIQLRFRLLLAPAVLLYAGALLAEAPLWFRVKRGRFILILLILLTLIPFVPGVWPVALVLIGMGFWQAIRQNIWRETRWLLLIVWSLFVLTLLSAQIITAIHDIGQAEDYFLGPEIVGDIFLGQTFQPDCNGLNRIRLTLGVYNQAHNQPVTFKLYSQTTGQEIFASQIPAEDLTDRSVKEFAFTPQPDSSRQSYLAYLSSPASHPGNSITLRGFSSLPVDWYPGGTAVVAQGEQIQPFPGDLAFAAFCDMGLVQQADQAFAALPGSRWLYWVLLAGHMVLFTIAGICVLRDK